MPKKKKVRGNRPKAVKVCACARKSISKWRWIKLNVESEVDGISCENLFEMYRTSLKKPEGGWKCRQFFKAVYDTEGGICARGFRFDCLFAKDKVRCNKQAALRIMHAQKSTSTWRYITLNVEGYVQGVLNILFRVIQPCFQGDSRVAKMSGPSGFALVKGPPFGRSTTVCFWSAGIQRFV